MLISDFEYHLPSELIADYPLAERSMSRLCVFDSNKQSIQHRQFNQISDFFLPGDVLVLNDTKVIPARLFANKISGGRVEIMLERLLDHKRILVQAKTSKPFKPNQVITINSQIQFQFVAKQKNFYIFENLSAMHLLEIFQRFGHTPLPPYIKRDDEVLDKTRYQTVFAKTDGAVAAPTASLHFDAGLLAAIQKKGVSITYLTLHVGAGTYQPVRSTDIRKHRMHSEWMQVSQSTCDKIGAAKANGKRIIAAGTTVLRALESATAKGVLQPFVGETDIFIYPGFKFQCVDMLITNFHLPGSSLLMLVAAFAGKAKIMDLYSQCIKQKYRFYSYGDAMLLYRQLRDK